MLAPIGYWNNAYHHGRVMHPTIERPQVAEREDGGSLLRVHSAGVQRSFRDLSDACLVTTSLRVGLSAYRGHLESSRG